jgi:AAA-like domain/PD-(D/E)XK nuclease superfamily
MAKKFNITGLCFPKDHYMADTSKKLEKTYQMVVSGDYFVINRPRQYGKTTMLYNLTQLMQQYDYIALNMSFEGIGDTPFSNETAFSQRFIALMAKCAAFTAPKLVDFLEDKAKIATTLNDVAKTVTEFVVKSKKKVVLLIDEVDKSSNNQLFVNFLAMLRNQYLDREHTKTFHSVVLAGVHDVKSLKLKIRPDTEQKLNSPWNIAAEFKVDMNLHPEEIKPMLDEYARDKNVQMDTATMAEALFYYTAGYPFLVSKLCKIIDEDILPTKTTQDWTQNDLQIALKELIGDDNTNFDSLVKNLENNPDLYQLVKDVVIEGESIFFNRTNIIMNFAILYGIFKNKTQFIQIHNRIYQEVIANHITFDMEMRHRTRPLNIGADYVNDDKTLNMEAIMLSFQAFMQKEYNKKDRDFLEKNGRLVFLAFLKPIINGSGYDFKEPQISEEQRLDLVVTYYNKKYIAELKLWRGAKAHEKGILQLANYLEAQQLNEGYLLIFDHTNIKKWQHEWIMVAGKRIFAAWV